MPLPPTEALDAPVHDVCPGCDVTGEDVYRAMAHPTWCRWMMYVARRCAIHDEILRPGEADCPHPDVDEEADDSHGRRIVR